MPRRRSSYVFLRYRCHGEIRLFLRGECVSRIFEGVAGRSRVFERARSLWAGDFLLRFCEAASVIEGTVWSASGLDLELFLFRNDLTMMIRLVDFGAVGESSELFLNSFHFCLMQFFYRS